MSATVYLVIAVIIDSLVTLFVGWRLERAARRPTANAVDTIKPAMDNSISSAIANAIPLVVKLLEEKVIKDGTTGIESNNRGTTGTDTEN